MLLQSGGEELLRKATELDPDFAMAHAALAMLGHEAGAEADVERLARSRASSGPDARVTTRERSLVNVVGLRVKDVQAHRARSR